MIRLEDMSNENFDRDKSGGAGVSYELGSRRKGHRAAMSGRPNRCLAEDTPDAHKRTAQRAVPTASLAPAYGKKAGTVMSLPRPSMRCPDRAWVDLNPAS